jgi:hypothetical protein
MNNKTILVLFSFLMSTQLFAQKLSIENTYEFESLKKDSYLGNVDYNDDDKTTTLSYVEKDMFRTVFTNYIFDEKLSFVREEQEKFNIIDVFKGEAGVDPDGYITDEVLSVRQNYPWFDYRGETYSREMVYVDPAWGGKLSAMKVLYTYTFNWNYGFYSRKMKTLERQTITGADDQRIYLYDRVNNYKTGEVFLLIGLKTAKGDKSVKWQHAKKFQILKVNSNFEVEELETIEFPYGMAISYMNVLSRNREPEFDGEGDALDISQGQLAVVFSPIKSVLAKSVLNPDPADQTLVLINSDGHIASKIEMTPPTSGWVIEDYALSYDGKDCYFFGPAKEEKYVNTLQPCNSPLSGQSEVKDIKYRDYQVMKISNGQLAWTSSTNLDEFSAKAVTPPSQKASPEYRGRNFQRNLVFVTPAGELILSGQMYTTKTVPDPNSANQTIKIIDDYKDLLMFHFDNKGNLKAQYGIRRDRNNQWSKANMAPQEVALSADGKKLYWSYGELQGMRRGFELGGGLLEMTGNSTLSKSKLLYYPTVARVDLAGGTIGDFVALGADDNEKQLYYTNPEFPSLISQDGTQITYVGESKNGKIIWLGRMNLE